MRVVGPGHAWERGGIDIFPCEVGLTPGSPFCSGGGMGMGSALVARELRMAVICTSDSASGYAS